MPTFQGQVSEEQLLQLIAYIKSLGAERERAGRSAAERTQPMSRADDDRSDQPATQLPERRLRRPVVAADRSTTSASRSCTWSSITLFFCLGGVVRRC